MLIEKSTILFSNCNSKPSMIHYVWKRNTFFHLKIFFLKIPLRLKNFFFHAVMKIALFDTCQKGKKTSYFMSGRKCSLRSKNYLSPPGSIFSRSWKRSFFVPSYRHQEIANFMPFGSGWQTHSSEKANYCPLTHNVLFLVVKKLTGVIFNFVNYRYIFFMKYFFA